MKEKFNRDLLAEEKELTAGGCASDKQIERLKEIQKIKKETAGEINLVFFDKESHVNEKKGATTTLVNANVCPRFGTNRFLTVWAVSNIDTVGVAYCSDEDHFDETKGKRISSARAENAAYEKAIDYLQKLEKEASDVANACLARIELLKENMEHNRKYIKNVYTDKVTKGSNF